MGLMQTVFFLAFVAQFTVSVDPVFSVTVEEPQPQEYYVVVFSAPYCQPCHQFAASEDMAKIRSRYTVRTVDITVDTRWGIDRIPSVWLCRTVTTRREQGVVLHRWRGRVTVDELRARE